MSLLTVVVILLLIGMLFGLGAAQRRFSRLRDLSTGLLVSYITVMLLLAAGELYFRYVYMDSAWLWTRAGERWHAHYVQNNALGFRDRDWTPADWEGRQTVLVIGDSFTQGFGIEDPDDRYSSVLARLLGDDYAVINIGVPDTSTREQYDIFAGYPLDDPDIVIWQYFLNDITDAGLSIGDHWWPRLPLERPAFVEESHLANFVYWRTAPLFTVVDVVEDQSYWDWAYYAYDNYAIWEIHRWEIARQVEQILDTGARLIVILYPNPLDPVGSIPYVDRVVQYLHELGVTETLPLYDDIAHFYAQGYPVVVSPRDPHPSKAFNHHLGQRIYDEFFASAN